MRGPEAFSRNMEPSPSVLVTLQLAAANAQRDHRPTFGSHDVLLQLIGRELKNQQQGKIGVLGELFQKHRPRPINLSIFKDIFEQTIHTIPTEHTANLEGVTPALEQIHVQRLAQQFARLEHKDTYTEKHLIKAMLINDGNPQIVAACSEAGINRKGLAQQIK